MGIKALSLFFAALLRFAHGGDPINDPYEAAIVAAEVTGLNETVQGNGYGGKDGTAWLVATGITGSRLKDLRQLDRKAYGGTAIHRIDAIWGRRRYHNAVERGYLRPETCQHHFDDGATEVWYERPYAKWSTRGPYEMGVATKFKLMSKWVGTDCFSVEWFDVPLFSAIAAAEYAKSTCDHYNRGSKSRKCDWHFLRCVWAGVGFCQDKEFRRGVRTRFSRRIAQARRIMRERGDLPQLPQEPQAYEVPAEPLAFIEEGDPFPYPPPRPHELFIDLQ